MKKFHILLILFAMWHFFSSCYMLGFRSMGVFDDTISFKKLNSSSKQIVYLPMHHIGERKFYENVKRNIDSLKKEGFVVFFEGTKFSHEYDTLKNDTIAMKLRKIISLDFRSMKKQGGYIDTVNNTFMGKKMKAIEKYDIVNQPLPYVLFDTTKDRRVDAYLSDALAAYELKFGKVILTDCDYTTKPDEKYHCKKVNSSKKKNFILLEFRNELIAKEVLKEEHNKIAMVYGAKHFDGILSNLKKQDSTWKIQ